MTMNMALFSQDVNVSMTEIRRLLEHWGLKDWREYLVVRVPGKPQSFIVLAHPSDKSDFADQLVRLHKSDVKGHTFAVEHQILEVLTDECLTVKEVCDVLGTFQDERVKLALNYLADVGMIDCANDGHRGMIYATKDDEPRQKCYQCDQMKTFSGEFCDQCTEANNEQANVEY